MKSQRFTKRTKKDELIKVIKVIAPKALKRKITTNEATTMTQEIITETKSRAVRRDKGQTVTTPRDLLLLRWINEQQAISIDHLQILLARNSDKPEAMKDEKAVSLPAASRTITRWLKMNYIETAKINNRVWIWCSTKGINTLDLDYGYYEPTLFNHIYEVNKVRLYWEAQNIQWTPERYLRKTHGKGHRLSQHFPDGEILYKGNQLAIEVELSNKRGEHRNKIVERYKVALINNQKGRNAGLFGYHYEGLIYYTNEKTHTNIAKAFEGNKAVKVKKLSDIKP